ncbi:DegV family protein [Halanaerocella petrolearia]
MAKIALVTDSTADLKREQLEEYDIIRIPLQVSIGGKDYKDWVDIGPDKFLEQLDIVDKMPTTSQPPIGEFVQLYERLADDYDAIISLHLSSELSGTVRTARLAADMIDDTKIKVVDSGTVTFSLGIMAIEVAKRIKAGANLQEIIKFIDQLQEKVQLYFTVEKLDYLEKGGRIGKAASFLGNLFRIRPLLTLEEGEVTPYKKIRGEKRLYNSFKQVIEQELSNKEGRKLVVLYGKYQDKADKLKQILIKEFSWQEVEMAQFGSVIGSHVGPTPFGVAFYK